MPLWYGKPKREILLAWTASTSGTVIGYNVYRSTVGAGGPFSLLAGVVPATTYLDLQINPGQTYWYEVTATDGTNESADTPVIQVTAQGPP